MADLRRSVAEMHGDVAGVPVFWLEAPTPGRRPPVLYAHGVPTHSEDFVPFLLLTGGMAPDLPGFGRSGKPAHFDYSIAGYERFVEGFLEQRGVGRVSLVVHDWGAAALAWAQRHPERVERLVVVNAVPLLPGYRWHPIARIWRTPLAGELFMGFSTRWAFRRLSARATAGDGPAPDELVDRAWRHFDHGTQRAILKLYRSAPTHELARAGERLGDLDCPALVLWGAEDPYIPAAFAAAYAGALGGEATVSLAEGAGHWPWIDRPELVRTVADFLLAG